MKTNFTLVLGLTLYSSLTLLSQKETEQWYFGRNCALNFNSGVPVAMNNSGMFTDEGCSSIADSAGNLLFYTDGSAVFNNQHDTMPNGFGLHGDISSTQSALIVHDPGNSKRYYVFTIDADGGPFGFQYSVVDMTLDGGKGDVTVKNVPIQTKVTEKISAVGNDSGTGYWVVIHEWGTNAFRSYRLTSTGFDTSAVVSNVGIVHSDSIFQNGYGQLKFSPDGNRVAVAIGYMSKFQVFDFDKNTGVVSNPILLAGAGRCYGLEFSPDNQKLYTTRWDLFFDLYYLEQWDLSSGNPGTIQASATILSNSENLRALQLGPDKKIYVAKAFIPALGVINAPDSLGMDANYEDNTVSLDLGGGTLGLPNFVQSYFRRAPAAVVSASDTILCPGDCVNYSGQSSGAISYQWIFPGGNPPSSTEQNPQVCYAMPGNYTATLIAGNQGGYDTSVVFNFVEVLPLPPISITVNGDTFRVLNGITFQWFLNSDTIPGATGNIYVATSAGVYTVAISDSAGCIAMSNPITITGLSGIAGIKKMKVFPVPAGDYVSIRLPENKENSSISIHNVLGAMIKEINVSAGDNVLNIDIGPLPKGYYTIRYKTSSEQITSTLIKD